MPVPIATTRTHAREWVGPPTSLFIATQLADASANCYDEESNEVSNENCDQDTKKLLDTYDWYITPNVNPDGYVFSWTNDRMWRKTRSPVRTAGWGFVCRGVDPNRNYDSNFAGEGSSNNPCTQNYHGPKAFSEPETRHLSEFVMSMHENIKFFLTYHSYSQLMLLPLGYTEEPPKDYDEIEDLAKRGAEVMKQRYGTEYKYGSSSRILYKASGTASDWAYEKALIKYSTTFELRDTGKHGFTLPPEEILPNCLENWDTIKFMTLRIAEVGF